jgi:hypothetical protein
VRAGVYRVIFSYILVKITIVELVEFLFGMRRISIAGRFPFLRLRMYLLFVGTSDTIKEQ